MASLSDFAALLADVWSQSVFGLGLAQILSALGIFLAFYLLRGLSSRFILSFLKRMAARTATPIDDMLYDALLPPLRFLFIVAGLFFALDMLPLSGALETLAANGMRSLVAAAIFWALYNAVDLLEAVVKKIEKILSPELVSWGVKAVRWGIIALGGSAILQIWGIQIAPLIAGLGLFGLAVALGAQDLFKNLLGGLSILIERRFRKGDWIKVEDVVEGTVDHIGFRSTRIVRFDQAPVSVPNSVFADNAVTNFSAMTHRRIYWLIGLEYRTSVPQLRRIREEIENAIKNDESFAQPPSVPLFVRIDSFTDSAVTIMLYCFTKTTKWGEWLAIKENLALRVKEIVEGAGAGFAFPSRALYIETLPQSGAEIFTPPDKKETKT